MEKKQYIKPAQKVYPVTPAHIICTSDENNVKIQMYDSDTLLKPTPDASGFYWGD